MTAVEFPISIGLIGAPGSGKAALADAFVNLSADWFAENGSEFRVINAGGKTLEESGVAMGVVGSWADDLRAYFKNYEAEQQARADGVSYLSLGTVFENIAHTGTNLENIVTGLAMPDQQQRIQRQQLGMSALTFLFTEQFRYVFGFYLPYSGPSVILPGQDDSGDLYNMRVDQGIKIVMGNFGLRIQVLDQPTIEEKAQEMFSTIKDIVENGVPEPTAEEEAMGDHPDAPDAAALADVVPPEAEATLAE